MRVGFKANITEEGRKRGNNHLEPLPLPIPRTDEEVFKLLHAFPIALANVIGATVRLDNIVTLDEYRVLATVASVLDDLTPRPGLMTTLILRATLQGPSYKAALRSLKAAVKEIPEQDRLTTLRAVAPLIDLQADRSAEIAADWSSALDIPQSQWREPSAQPRRLSPSRFLARLGSFRLRKETLLDRARALGTTFDDADLAAAVLRFEASRAQLNITHLEEELRAAAQRILARVSHILKSREQLEHQKEVSCRFLALAEALAAQIRLRLESVRDRLQLQSEMFQEDLSQFIRNSLESVEVSMRDLMEGREHWADETIWAQFKERGVCTDILTHFQPLKNRYERLFAQWQRELESFSGEIGALRAGVLQNIDPQAFAALLPTEHSSVRLRNALDRAAKATLSATLGLGVLGTVGAVLTGTGSVLAAFMLANPAVALTIGAATLTATAWRVFADPEARKRRLTQDKRHALEVRLREMLTSEALNHDKLAQEIMEKFLAAACDNYAPLIIDARMAALRADLEAEVVNRILTDTRRAVMNLTEA